MKNTYFKFCFLLIFNALIGQTLIAQKSEVKINPKSIAGNYQQESTAGIYIFEDNTFALFGYATLVFGKYQIAHHEIKFTPDKPKQTFAIIGRENKEMKQNGENVVNFTFDSGFMRNDQILMNDGNGFKKVCEDNFNGGAPYYSIDFVKKPNKISFVENSNNNKYNTTSFNLDGKYNEFILFYTKTIKEEQEFRGTFETNGNEKVLMCRWGSFEKKEAEKEMLTYIENYKKQKNEIENIKTFYFNDQLKSVNIYKPLNQDKDISLISNYVFDKASNKYIHKNIFEKGRNYMNSVVEEYNNEDIILEYHLLEIAELDILT